MRARYGATASRPRADRHFSEVASVPQHRRIPGPKKGLTALPQRRVFIFDRKVLSWYPVYGHPNGASAAPWFHQADGEVWPAAAHPSGASSHVWFVVTDDVVRPHHDHPDGPSAEPWFRISGSLVHPTDGHPDGASFVPWYQIRR